ncbi:hypothetical protein Naga_100019g61 [Nannochloropsis gaditana]|uniref:Uncharacterized protein n=1 Tax=Nannochloropsis gaditana TaxID=72520 RepID=W7TLZ6_9STRA|nr:hypothetical protein Naga_100019g61 [Nannochloropsis gaditana]
MATKPEWVYYVCASTIYRTTIPVFLTGVHTALHPFARLHGQGNFRRNIIIHRKSDMICRVKNSIYDLVYETQIDTS